MNDKRYKIVNGIAFDERTDNRICGVLADAWASETRLRVYYGDTETGECWMDELDTIGRIGRSMGTYKIPLLIKTRRSIAGGAILDHCVIRIDDVTTGRMLYQHPKFHFKEVEVRGTQVYVGGELYANTKTEGSAKRLADFLLGKRHNTGGRDAA